MNGIHIAIGLKKVAPPRGERGLKQFFVRSVLLRLSRSPSWGAWIETPISCNDDDSERVAPPRGERGLKRCWNMYTDLQMGRSPSWGAWIETF